MWVPLHRKGTLIEHSKAEHNMIRDNEFEISTSHSQQTRNLQKSQAQIRNADTAQELVPHHKNLIFCAQTTFFPKNLRKGMELLQFT